MHYLRGSIQFKNEIIQTFKWIWALKVSLNASSWKATEGTRKIERKTRKRTESKIIKIREINWTKKNWENVIRLKISWIKIIGKKVK